LSTIWTCPRRCSAADIFDPATVSAFATNVVTHERLQRLCLLTYADIHAVNPEALTPWKAEMLWRPVRFDLKFLQPDAGTATGCTLPTKRSCWNKCGNWRWVPQRRI